MTTPSSDPASVIEALIDSDQLAERLGVAAGTVRNWRSSGTGPPWIKVGGQARYRPSDITAWLEANEVAG